ncbi:MAG: hypothetical protein ASUL_07159 [Candidatus Aramenus sulfurataquae]|jgi:hypothetical protein|uniref:Uncharacterized protein n=2 Tax=Candidatus Aramenus sulfurataquae TaxID=1326980 RepID=W7KL64_9CREN|nr:MAG: hypothetical protein ASUL_07159 [Candidatus Aramenus sulfurataquae]MCL7343576.1 hypothetical protein [Candidatus Aramenus sulfurataquae]
MVGLSLEDVFLFLLSWVLISIVVYFASKFFTRDSTLSKAFLATLAALVVFAVLYGISSFFLKGIIPQIIGFIGILWVFKTVFNVGWLGALGIAVLSAVMLIIVEFIVVLLFGVGHSLLHV